MSIVAVLRIVKKVFPIILILIRSMNTTAQTPATIVGEYYLRGVMEMASGIKLNPDSSFEFFFSYGALDRNGAGKWSLKDSSVILDSPIPASQDFALVSNKTVNNDQLTIKILEQNPSFLAGVYALIKSNDKEFEAESNSNGEISFPKVRVDSITLRFEFCPEKKSVFTFTKKDDDYFEFRFEPTIMDINFENVALRLTTDGLEGQHPLLKKGIYQFKKLQ